MFYLLLLLVGAVGVGIYVLFIFHNVPGMADERFGVLEPLPSDVGRWKTDQDSHEAKRAASEGLLRETRTFFDEERGRLLEQARYRSRETGAVVKADPDRVVRRQRVRKT